LRIIINNIDNKEKKSREEEIFIKCLLIIFKKKYKSIWNPIESEGANNLGQGLKTMTNLTCLNLNLG
jgi:hypothetical protein